MIRNSGLRRACFAALMALPCVVAAEPVAEDAAALRALAAEVAAGEHDGIHGFVLQRDGHEPLVGLDGSLAPGGGDIRSATKSVTALLVGIAITRGHLEGVDQAAVELLPELAREARRDPRKAAITLEDLLTMRSGLDCDDWNPDSPGHEDTMYRRRDWVRFWARVPMREDPGTRFSYCTGNVVALGRILETATGMEVPDFAQRFLFGPLGITEARWDRYNRDRDTDTGGHLRIHPLDLAKIGQLVMRRGRWQDEALVPEDWIDRMTTVHAAIPAHSQQYGYLWWLDRTKNPALRHARLQMAWGNGGNFMIVLPELDTVIVFAGSRYNRPDGLEPLKWLGERILPALADPVQDRSMPAEPALSGPGW